MNLPPLPSSPIRRYRQRLLLLMLLSLLIHLLTTWLCVRAFTNSPGSPENLPPDLTIVDLVQAANKITPDRAHLIGKQSNSTTEETVAVTQPGTGRGGQGAAKKRPNQSSSLPVPSPPHPVPRALQRRAPATALTQALNGGSSGTVPEDYFPDFKRGAHTYVNVLKHPEVDFFVEMKSALRITWNPSPAIRANLTQAVYDKGVIGMVIGATVDAQGHLTELFVLRSSGMAAYDQEGLRTFRASAPFFPPPAKILGLDGATDHQLHMSWALVTYLR